MTHDHRMPPAMLDAVSYPGAQEAKPLYRAFIERDGVHRILLVANQTLGADPMMEALAERRQQHPEMSVYVLVPATPAEYIGNPPMTRPGMGEAMLDARTDDVGLAAARYRLRRTLAVLGDQGIVAHGTIGDPNPVRGIARVMGSEPIDEMIICTLRLTVSRWLHADLPTMLRRSYDCPITVLSMSAADQMAEQIDLTQGVSTQTG